MTYTDFISLFSTVADALEYEDRVLSIGQEYLPDCVLSVVEDGDEPTAEYWSFLMSQVDVDLATARKMGAR